MSDPGREIPSTADLKAMGKDQLSEVAFQIRRRLIDVTSINGGHLASSLGVVELTLALHKVFDFPKDKLVFDVGHQSYAHKLLTDRQGSFSTLRTHGGISGFTRKDESPYDVHDSGHASDSLSTALGLAISRDLKGTDEQVVALVGDAAISGGMAFEALNHIGFLGTDMTIVLNDNDMSISRNVGALSLHLGKARISKPYTKLRDAVEGGIGKVGSVGRFLVNTGEKVKQSFKKLMVPGTFFEDIGIIYIGPIDGHNIALVSDALQIAKKHQGPVLVHVVTQKGKGYTPAERQPDVFHGVGGYDPSTGSINGSTDLRPTYTQVFSEALMAEAEAHDNIVAITAAMSDGTGLSAFKEQHPERFFDVGIAEEHAVTLASGLAIGGQLPVVAIYSTFLQRAYDQIAINVALQDLHVVFCIDRAGLVGEDGTTHHGVFDMSYLRMLPNMKILAPASADELRDGLHTALCALDGPVALRYPRGKVSAVLPSVVALDDVQVGRVSASGADGKGEGGPQVLALGKAKKLRAGTDLSILAVGRMVETAYEAAALLAAQGIDAAVYNMLWIKPIDVDAVLEAAQTGFLVTLEEGSVIGGFGSAVLEVLASAELSDVRADGAKQHSQEQRSQVQHSQKQLPKQHSAKVLNIGIGDEFVSHGSIEQLLEGQALDAATVAVRIANAFNAKDQTH